MASYNSDIRCQPRQYRCSHAGTKHLSRIQVLVTKGTYLLLKTKNKTGVLNQPDHKYNIKATMQRSCKLAYTTDFLKSIKCKVDHDQRYKLLHPNICSMVRELKLNRKKSSRGNNQV